MRRDGKRRGLGDQASERRYLVIALALLGLAMLPALQPLMGPEPTCGYDNAFHLWRAVQIDHLWEQGVLYSRWAPDMAHGFGYPLFLYASPFPPALVALLHRIGLLWPVALNAVFALGVVIGGYGMFWLAYRLVRNEMDHQTAALVAGITAGAAYVYAPFQAYDLYNRGSLWEAFAWAFPPLLLLGIHEWSVNRDRRFLVLGAGALGGMILSHHVFAFLFGPVFALWVVAHAMQRREWGVLFRGVLASLLGLGWTTFFWLPPYLEKPLVQADRLLNTWVFDYRYNFLSPGHLLALPRIADPRLLNDWPEKALGLAPVLLALLSLAGWRRLSKAARWRLVLLWGLVIVFSLLLLPVSQWLWDRISLLVYVQFPWRYLGPGAFCVALLIGLGAARVWRATQAVRAGGWRKWGAAVLPGAILMITMTANMGWFYPRHCAAVSDTSMAALIAWERVTDTLGTTAKGEYLPKWIERFPDITLDANYRAGGEIVRLRQDDLPEGAEIVSADYGATRARIVLATSEAFRARYLAFYYPGWKVKIDRRSVPVMPEAETGLLTFDVPSGTHTVEVRFGETPMRLVGDGVSILSVMAVCAILIRTRRLSRWCVGEQLAAVKPQVLVAIGGALGVVVLGKWLLVDTQGVLWRSSRLTRELTLAGLDSAALARVPEPVNFGNQALLMGIEPVPEAVVADEAPVLTLYWRALSPEPRDWRVGLTLVAEERVTAEHDAGWWTVELRPVRWAREAPPVIEWAQDDYARMDLHLDLQPGMPPGRYDMRLSLFDRATAEPASVLDLNGNPVGPVLSLGSLTVSRPTEPPSLQALGVAGADGVAEHDLQVCGPVGLWQAALDREVAAPGELVTLRMVWESVAATTDTLTATVLLRDEADTVLKTWRLAPAAASWPTSSWSVGERWVGQAMLRLPGSLEGGFYNLALHLDPACSLDIWRIEIVAPERAWEAPPDFEPVAAVSGAGNVTLGDINGPLVRLAGVRLPTDVARPGDTLDLALAWEALAEMTASYRVFVHLVDDAGTLHDQNDGEPVGWTRPTPGWAVGEIVAESRPLTVPASAPAGAYTIRVGLYLPEGARLTTPSGDDGIVVGKITVSP